MIKIARIIIGTALIVLLSACGGGTTGNTSPSPTVEETRPTRTPRPAASNPSPTANPSPAALPTTASVGASERPPVINTQTDFRGLGNVQVEMNMAGVAREEGKPEEPFNLLIRQIILENGDRSLTIESTSADSRLVRITNIQIGGETYQYSEEGSQQFCFSMGSMADLFEGSMLTPDQLIGNLESAQLVERGVQVNGFTTDRYTFSVKEQTANYQGEAKGEIWAASNPAIVVRHVGELIGTITGIAEENGTAPLPSQLGNLRWEYNVTRLAANTTLSLPEACAQQQAASADIPLPPNVSNQARMGDLISFETADSPENVATFYQTEMAAKGWRAGNSSQYENTYLLTFTKDGREVSITISVIDKKTMVIITISSS
jgi:hypothetical protein